MLAFFLLGAALIAIGLFLSSLTESQIIAAVITFGAIILCYLANPLKNMVSGSANTSMIVFTALILVAMLIIRYMTKNWTTALSVAVVLEIILLALRFMAADAMKGAITALLGSISVFVRMDNFMDGMFDVTAIVYYITVAGLFLFFSFQSVEKRRWS
jgi:ABC-2 type transport system permease protein